VSEQLHTCKFCGKTLQPGQFCPECTLTDLELPPVVVITADDLRADTPAYLVETRTKNRFPINGSKWKVGRDPTNQVIIQGDPYTSRFHAWITLEEEHYFVEDLGSTNGTLLNGQPLIRRRPLVNGDRIRIGRTDFSFILDHDLRRQAGHSVTESSSGSKDK
jgi:pSer/pThr/pTyr-binding forkhead associated (FHA) protein